MGTAWGRHGHGMFCVNRPLSEADHQLSSTTEVKNAWSHDLESPNMIHILHKDTTLLHFNSVTPKANFLLRLMYLSFILVLMADVTSVLNCTLNNTVLN